MALELRHRLHGRFGGALTITATAVFDYPTIGSLAEWLAGQISQPADGRAVDATAPTQ